MEVGDSSAGNLGWGRVGEGPMPSLVCVRGQMNRAVAIEGKLLPGGDGA